MFPVPSSLLSNRKYWIFIVLPLFLASCSTMSIQNNAPALTVVTQEDRTPVHTFFLVGDAGDTTYPHARKTLNLLEEAFAETPKNSTLLFLGDNIYPKGLPADTTNVDYPEAESRLKLQLETASKFEGATVFIPGNHDWYNGIDGLKAQEAYVADFLQQKKAFLPRKSCAIETLKINDNVGLIVIDSEWFLQDWNKYPTINDECDFRTRDEFLDELKSEINKNQNKFTIIAMHHPLITYGPHGGVYSARQHLYPINNGVPMPFLGTVINFLRKTTGASPQDNQNKQYRALVDHIKPMVQNLDNVLVVSGHDHNLQYIEEDGIKQLISGSASKREAARAVGEKGFSFGGFGFTKLDVFEDQSAILSFFSTESALKQIHQILIAPESQNSISVFEKNDDKTVVSSIYNGQKPKSKFYKYLWGDHYRPYYSLPIEARLVKIDTLFGGLRPSISGGGTQSESLRLVDAQGKEYVMRALKKNATRFLQSVFSDQNALKSFEDTYAEKFIFDFYTTAHPFTPFIIDDLAKPLGIYHTNPQLYFVPQQPRLGKYNTTFGSKLFMIEERQTDEHIDLASFGKPQSIIGTDDLLKNLRKDEKYKVDEDAYIRARLFDMLIGDWDRHQDQWRWSEFAIGDRIVYKPIPRDRDQAFAKVDGALLKLLVKIPGARHITNFEADYPSEKWFNFSAHPLDVAFIKEATSEDWSRHAKFIVQELTQQQIDTAFAKLPIEIRNDATTQSIKSALANRKLHLEDFALTYYKLLQERIILTGTDKKDKFTVERLPSNKTKITHIRTKQSGDQFMFSRSYNNSETKEIWIYGLGDDDIFEVTGDQKSSITIRLIGGQNHDNYTIQNGKKIKIYDYKSKNNTISATNGASVNLKDDYEINEYHYKKPKYSQTFTLPMLGYNPDDGVKVGGIFTYTHQGFKNPFTSKHNFGAYYYFATDGFELSYKGDFTKVVGNMNLQIDALYTSPNFSTNFFGYGNQTQNFDSDTGMDFNRVRIQTVRMAPSLKYEGRFGSEVILKASFENIDVERTPNRFVANGSLPERIFEDQQFATASFTYAYNNYDDKSNPTLGFTFSASSGWTTNLSDTKRNFPYFEGHLGFSHYLDNSKKLVLGTLVKGKALLNNNFEFYQGATLGGDYDLRGFRDARFVGKQSFYQSTDLRWNMGSIKKNLLPMTYGILGGYDYGRVWLDGENSNKWHQSVGGGIWLNAMQLATARLTFFNSADGNRIAFGLGFGF